MELTKWLNKLVIILVLLTSLIPATSYCQQTRKITLGEVQQLARSHYPISRRKDLLDQTREINIANLAKGYLPQVSLNGQATYQSDVTKVNISIPGVGIAPLAKDQYKFSADVNQSIFDGGVIRQSQKVSLLNTEVQQKQLEVELYQLRERINQVYLTILYLDEQLKQVELIEKDLQTGITKTRAQVNNGVAFRSNLDVLEAEMLKQEQRVIELQASREGLLQTLSLLTGETLSKATILEKPVTPVLNKEIRRPELSLYQSQTTMLDQQKKLLNAKNLPRLSAFGQGGYGRPGLNMLDSQFDWFYIAGLRLNWSLGGLYLLKNEKRQLALDKNTVALQRETFLLNNQTQLSQLGADIKKQLLLIEADEKIITLREKITGAARAQLENGVITANDYLREVNAMDQARQSRALHELQLLQSQINYQNLTGI